MAKYNSPEAFYARLQQLGETKKIVIKEGLTIGTLIDYERASDGMAYGIIKENHHYYVKKGGIKQNPDAADFVYIGGTENITNYQYGSISEAQKKRNLLMIAINESSKLKTNKTSSKVFLTEDFAGEEIEKSAEQIPDLDAAASAEAQPEMPIVPDLGDTDSIPPVGNDVAADGIPDAGAEGNPNMGGSEDAMPDAGLEMPDASTEPEPDAEAGLEDAGAGDAGMGGAGEESEQGREITKALGKLTNTLRKTEMTPIEVKTYVNTFLSAFEGQFDELEVEERKDIADRILKTNPGAESDLEQSMPSEPVEETQGECAECGGFGAYAESRGYTKEAFMECDNSEKASLISGYKLKESDGEVANDDDTIALLGNEEIAEALSTEYGHEDYVSEVLNPKMNQMSEGSEEDKQLKINEISWGGLKNVGSFVGKGIGNAVGGAASAVGKGIGNAASAVGNKVGQAANAVGSGISNAASAVGSAVGKAGSAVGSAVGNAATAVGNKAGEVGQGISQQYNKGVQNDNVAQLTKLATELKQKVDALNASTMKAGGQAINTNELIDLIGKQLKYGEQSANLSGFKAVEEGIDDGHVLAKNTTPTTVAKQSTDKAIMGENSPGVSPLAKNATPTTVAKQSTDKAIMGENSPGVSPLAKNATPTTVAKISTDKAIMGEALPVDKGNSAVNLQENDDEHEETETPGDEAAEHEIGGDEFGGEPEVTVEPEVETPAIEFGAGSQNLGLAGLEPKGAGTSTIDISVDGNTKMLNIQMSESERKIRNYVRKRLEENSGLRKPSLNEGAKSEKMKQLDKLIDTQFEAKRKKK